jgi:hypothetical protein
VDTDDGEDGRDNSFIGLNYRKVRTSFSDDDLSDHYSDSIRMSNDERDRTTLGTGILKKPKPGKAALSGKK